jgi:hypothetical protein
MTDCDTTTIVLSAFPNATEAEIVAAKRQIVEAKRVYKEPTRDPSEIKGKKTSKSWIFWINKETDLA